MLSHMREMSIKGKSTPMTYNVWIRAYAYCNEKCQSSSTVFQKNSYPSVSYMKDSILATVDARTYGEALQVCELSRYACILTFEGGDSYSLGNIIGFAKQAFLRCANRL